MNLRATFSDTKYDINTSWESEGHIFSYKKWHQHIVWKTHRTLRFTSCVDVTLCRIKCGSQIHLMCWCHILWYRVAKMLRMPGRVASWGASAPQHPRATEVGPAFPRIIASPVPSPFFSLFFRSHVSSFWDRTLKSDRSLISKWGDVPSQKKCKRCPIWNRSSSSRRRPISGEGRDSRVEDVRFPIFLKNSGGDKTSDWDRTSETSDLAGKGGERGDCDCDQQSVGALAWPLWHAAVQGLKSLRLLREQLQVSFHKRATNCRALLRQLRVKIRNSVRLRHCVRSHPKFSLKTVPALPFAKSCGLGNALQCAFPYMHIHINVYMHIYIYTYICIYIYAHAHGTHTQTHTSTPTPTPTTLSPLIHPQTNLPTPWPLIWYSPTVGHAGLQWHTHAHTHTHTRTHTSPLIPVFSDRWARRASVKYTHLHTFSLTITHTNTSPLHAAFSNWYQKRPTNDHQKETHKQAHKRDPQTSTQKRPTDKHTKETHKQAHKRDHTKETNAFSPTDGHAGPQWNTYT